MSDSETDTLNHSGGECWHVLSVSSRSRTIWYFLCTCWELFQTWQLLSCWTGFSHSEVYFNSVHLVFLSDFQNYRMRCFFHGTHSRLTQRDVFSLLSVSCLTTVLQWFECWLPDFSHKIHFNWIWFYYLCGVQCFGQNVILMFVCVFSILMFGFPFRHFLPVACRVVPDARV